MTLYVERALPDALSVVWGTPGNAGRAKLRATSHGFDLNAPLILGLGPKLNAFCQPKTQLEAATFSFSHDAGGSAQLNASGAYSSQECSYDSQGEYWDGPAVLLGVVDATDPTFKSPPDVGGLLSLDLSFSEPLRANTTMTMREAGSGAVVALKPTVDESFVVGGGSDLVLPFGSNLELSFSGADLGGRPLPASATLTTIDDFGVLAQDGFESNSTTGIWPPTGPQIVTQFKGEGAIAGTHMLHVPAGTHAMLRLQRTATETHMVASLRLYTKCVSGLSRLRLTAAVVGGSSRTQIQPPIGTTTALPDDMLIGEAQNISLSLSDAGKDVVLSVLGENHTTFDCIHAGILLDDVRLQ